ncbi:hypothetical protein pb186bvf_009430 [Paramecium bursaria]
MQQVLSQMEELQQLNPVIQGNGQFKEFPFAERFAEYQILRCNNESLIPLCIDVDPSLDIQEISQKNFFNQQEIKQYQLQDKTQSQNTTSPQMRYIRKEKIMMVGSI